LYDPLIELPSGYLQATYTLWPLASNLKPEDAQIITKGDLESRTGLSIDEFVTFALESGSSDVCIAVSE
jgi:hypothetical protein